MAINFYGAIGLTGGADGSLDDIDGATLVNGDRAIVITATHNYVYVLDATSGAGEASPGIIEPDANSGAKRWILVAMSDQDVSVASSPEFAVLTLSTGLSLGFGELVSEQNPDAVNAIRLKGTSSDVDIVIGHGTGYFAVWNAADNNAVFYVNNSGATDIAGNLTVGAGTGKLTAGSINRVAGSLFLEIAGIPQLSLSAIAAIFANDVLFAEGTQNYKWSSRSTNLILESQSSNTTAALEFYAKDGDGTDNIYFQLFGKGVLPTITGNERLRVGWIQGDARYSVASLADTANGGVVRPLALYTGTNTDQLVLQINGDVTLAKSIENPKAKMTVEGGWAIKLTNKTGGASVAGQLVAPYSATAVDDAVKTALADSDEVIGIVLDADVADGSEMWIVVSGIANVLMDAGGSARGDRIISSATAGSADVWNTGGAVATHFQEIGHCIETRGGAGLAKAVLHFN